MNDRKATVFEPLCLTSQVLIPGRSLMTCRKTYPNKASQITSGLSMTCVAHVTSITHPNKDTGIITISSNALFISLFSCQSKIHFTTGSRLSTNLHLISSQYHIGYSATMLAKYSLSSVMSSASSGRGV